MVSACSVCAAAKLRVRQLHGPLIHLLALSHFIRRLAHLSGNLRRNLDSDGFCRHAQLLRDDSHLLRLLDERERVVHALERIVHALAARDARSAAFKIGQLRNGRPQNGHQQDACRDQIVRQHDREQTFDAVLVRVGGGHARKSTNALKVLLRRMQMWRTFSKMSLYGRR